MADASATLAAELKAAIRTTRLSQAEVARVLGVTHKHVYCLLSGRTTLTIAWAEQIANVCGRRLEIRMVGGNGERTTSVPDPQESTP